MTNVLINKSSSPLGFSKFETNNVAVGELEYEVRQNRESPALCLDNKPIMVKQWQRYIERKIGFVLPSAQSKWLLNAVEQTAAKYKLSLTELWEMVQVNDQLQQQLLDTVLIPESRFFRHEPSIAFIVEIARQYATELSKKNTKTDFDNRVQGKSAHSLDEPFRIWSVGCATGQEVWSVAMTLAANNLSNYTILGTDVSKQALATARAGQYHQRQKMSIPPSYHRFMQPLTTEPQAHWQVKPKLHEQVSFIWHNIFTQSLATPHLQQVILCQNVLIYFRQFDQRDILARLTAQCVLGGYIILAPGEALSWRPSNMRRVAHTKINAWQKISA
ncbi:protein-glutamate O-methyltransferase CheR [uncultured Psychrobacter sp.]|uniref:CheR family methyltransferase n=1 Tax=uncultured Psychrobacter sp. TaxID=259303 RepID=UPI00345A7622